MKDLRDPRELGSKLLAEAERMRCPRGDVEGATCVVLPLSHVADHGSLHVRDYVDEGPLERYGDPVAKHEDAIEAGLSVRLP